LKKRTSINSIPRIHKEKEMADFRKWIYALAVVALLVGLSSSASAQTGSTTVTCNNGGATTPIVRSQGLTELMGDLVLNCTGGPATVANQTVPPVDITLILSVNITSKLTAGNLYNEALHHRRAQPARAGSQLEPADPELRRCRRTRQRY